MRLRIQRPFAALLLALAVPAAAQQHADAHFEPKVAHPAYAANGPVVAVDQAHHNFHTLDGKYAPFGRLLGADGYRVRPNLEPFSGQSLSAVNVLVISNALPADGGQAAFRPDEIAAIRQWVENGGSLLLIADHAPFGTAAAPLAAAFGVDMGEGFAAVRQFDKVSAQIRFWSHLLGTGPIMEGRDDSERIRSVESFTGQSLGIPPGATALLLLPRDAAEVANASDISALAHGASVSGRRVGGRAQAVALSYGRGRVVIAGEAAMFTEQYFPWGERLGLTNQDDQQFALNVLHWLSRLI